MDIYKDFSHTPEARAKDLLEKMTLTEKISQLQSVWGYDLMENKEQFSVKKADNLLKNGMGQITRPAGGTRLESHQVAEFVNCVQKYLTEETRLGIPAMLHEECLAGWQTKGATIFPQSIGIGSSWDPDIAEMMTKSIRRQLKSINTHQALAPVMDAARDPRWGRMEETYGEDPYLIASMGTAYVKGLQGENLKTGIGATLKHFAGYSACEGGLNWAPAHLPPREFREVYLFPFEAAIRAGKAMSVMNGYHELDGIPCGANRELLTGILRKEWGFDGIVVSDYDAIPMLSEYHLIASTAEEAGMLALKAGLDIELPKYVSYGVKLQEAVEAGTFPIEYVDTSVLRILTAKFRLGIFDNPYVNKIIKSTGLEQPEDRQLSKEIAQKTIILLKNENNILPLNRDVKKIAVIGPNADSWRNMLGDYSYAAVVELYEAEKQHEETGKVDPDKLDALPNISVPVISVLEGIKTRVSEKSEVVYARGCSVLGKSTEGFEEAVNQAKEADVAVMVMGGKSGFTLGCSSGEERDRVELNLPGVQEELVRAVHATGTPVIIVLINGRAYSIKWISENIPAIVEAWIPGEEGGNAIADVLFGDFNPGGKLPVTFPGKVGQIPAYYGHKPSAGRSHYFEEYVDGPTKCLFPFGHGLSYTTFEYSGLIINPEETNTDGKITVETMVKNTGQCYGDEVVQLYIRDLIASVTRPVMELKGFKRATIGPGASRKITFILPVELLAFYDKNMDLAVEPGEFEVKVGSSSEDIRQTGKFTLTGEKRIIKNRTVYFSDVNVE